MQSTECELNVETGNLEQFYCKTLFFFGANYRVQCHGLLGWIQEE